MIFLKIEASQKQHDFTTDRPARLPYVNSLFNQNLLPASLWQTAAGVLLRSSYAQQFLIHFNLTPSELLVEELDLATGDVVHRSDDTDFAAFEHLSKDAALLQDFFDVEMDVEFGDVVHKSLVGRGSEGNRSVAFAVDSEADVFEQIIQITKRNAVASPFDRAAIRVSHDHDEFRAERGAGKFEAADGIFGSDIARQADTKYVAQTLIKNQFGRDARVAATQNSRERELFFFGFVDQLEEVSVSAEAVQKTVVALFQKVERLFGSH